MAEVTHDMFEQEELANAIAEHVHSVECGHLQAEVYIDKMDAAGHDHHEHGHVHHSGCGHIGHENAHDHIDTTHVHTESCGHLDHSEAQVHIDNHDVPHTPATHHHETGSDHVHGAGCGHVEYLDAFEHIDHVQVAAQIDKQAATDTAAVVEALQQQLETSTSPPVKSEVSNPANNNRAEATSTRDTAPSKPSVSAQRISDSVSQLKTSTEQEPLVEPETTPKVVTVSVESPPKPAAHAAAIEIVDAPKGIDTLVNTLSAFTPESTATPTMTHERIPTDVELATNISTQNDAIEQLPMPEPTVEALTTVYAATSIEPDAITFAAGKGTEAVIEPIMAEVIPPDNSDIVEAIAAPVLIEKPAVAEIEIQLVTLDALLTELYSADDSTELLSLTDLHEELLEAGFWLQPEQRRELLDALSTNNVGDVISMFEELQEKIKAGLYQENGISSLFTSASSDKTKSILALGKIILQLFSIRPSLVS